MYHITSFNLWSWKIFKTNNKHKDVLGTFIYWIVLTLASLFDIPFLLFIRLYWHLISPAPFFFCKRKGETVMYTIMRFIQNILKPAVTAYFTLINIKHEIWETIKKGNYINSIMSYFVYLLYDLPTKRAFITKISVSTCIIFLSSSDSKLYTIDIQSFRSQFAHFEKKVGWITINKLVYLYVGTYLFCL